MTPRTLANTHTTAQETVPEDEFDASVRPDKQSLGLVVLWSRTQPDWLGAFLPVPFGASILGRGRSQASDPHPRLSAFRQRPGLSEHLPPLEAPALSRVLLLFERNDDAMLSVEKLGRTRIAVNNRETIRTTLACGDVLQLGQELSLLCTRRSSRLPAGAEDAPLHSFGQADRDGMVGETVATWKLRDRIAFVAPRAGHVLLLGESGVGKELVAAALHRNSKRRGAFICRNAITIPESLMDAELFGNVEDYPNPGMRERKGLIGAADGGTLLLDEFAELRESQQAHLLRVLDAGEYQRLGEARGRHSDLRLVAATNRPIAALRKDVLARFEFRVDVPSLAERREDIPLLIRHLLQRLAATEPAIGARFCDAQGEARVSPKLVQQLVVNPPEGNVRGLRQALWNALERSSGDTVEPLADTPDAPVEANQNEPRELDATGIQDALNASGGSIEKARRMLGLSSRFVLIRAMKKHGIEVRRTASSK